MKTKLFCFVTAGVFSALLAQDVAPARAAMCGKCRDLMFTDSQGKCIDCGGPTSSGALQLCPKCSAKRHQCEHCLARLSEKDEAAVEAAPVGPSLPEQAPRNGTDNAGPISPAAPINADSSPHDNGGKTVEPQPLATASKFTQSTTAANPAVLPGPASATPPESSAAPQPKRINPTRPGSYTSGKWKFRLEITNPDTRSEGRWGWLTYDGQKLPRGSINDYYVTPWGPMYWVDVPTTNWGMHGFMPIPLPQNPRQGHALALPAYLAAASGPAAQATSSPTTSAASSAPKVQTLEINRSHNGQMARLRVGNVLIIRLPGNPASGYQWQAGTANTQAMQMTVRPQYSPAPAGGNAPGTYTFVFQAVQPGTGSIRLYYMRPNESGRPRDAFAVGVTVAPHVASPSRSALPSYLSESR
jgi:inhibitor of cysteine peptidase